MPAAKPLAQVTVPSGGESAELSGSGSDSVPDEWEIRADELQLGPRVGIGSYGEVYRGVWRYTDVAVKRLIDQDLSPQLMEVCLGRPHSLVWFFQSWAHMHNPPCSCAQEFRAEISIMKKLRHVNVLLFLGAVTTPPELAIVTQFMPRGSLFRLLHRWAPLAGLACMFATQHLP